MNDVQLFFTHFALELFGTAILIVIGNGAVANMVLKNTKGTGGGYMAIAAGWGCGVLLGAMISTALHGVAHLNPAITLSFIIQKTWFNLHGWFLVPALLLGQILGALIGQIFVDIIYWKHLYQTINTEPNNLVLSMHATTPQNRTLFLNIFAEFIGTFVLVASVLAINRFSNSNLAIINPFFMGLVIFGIGLGLGGTTGYAINPVRDLIPRLVYFCLPIKNKPAADWKYSLVPTLTPLVSASVCSAIFLVI
ncbi:MIP/aquaporin family protein [Spiroplasma sp. DGKH1]|uniref:MIP/aquaporin family protein n=1 Tax=Spiroplasma sp. DGKH1 TaxID=3050074 RepID=UPI0034C6936B